MSDDLSDITDAIIDALNESGWDGSGQPGLATRAVFEFIEARYVPASAVNDLAQQWEQEAVHDIEPSNSPSFAHVAELRALTRHETK